MQRVLLSFLLLIPAAWGQFTSSNAKKIQGKLVETGLTSCNVDNEVLTWKTATNRFECASAAGASGPTGPTGAAGATGATGAAGATGATGSGVATMPFAPTRETASAANDRLRLNCDAAPYCSIRVNGIDAYTNTSDITATLSGTSATGSLYVYYTPSTQTIYCDENTAATLTVSGCTAATTGGIPAGSVPVGKAGGTYSFTSNAFADPSTSAAFPVPGHSFACGTNLSCTLNATTGELSVDTASTVLLKSGAQSGSVLRCLDPGTGSDDTYTCTMSPTLASYTDGMIVNFESPVANTGAATLQIDGIASPVSIKLCDGSTNPANGDIAADRPVQLTYDGTVFRLPCNPATVSGGGATINSTTFASLPGTCTDGNLYLFTDSLYNFARCGASNTYTYYHDGRSITPPTGSWSWDNQSTASITTTYGYYALVVPTSHTGGVAARYQTGPGSTWTRTFAVRHRNSVGISGKDYSFGVGVRESDTGKIEFVGVEFSSATTTSGAFLIVRRYTNSTTFSADAYNGYSAGDGLISISPYPLIYFRVQDNGTNLIYSWSMDGQNFAQLLSQSRTAFMSGAGPDQICFLARDPSSTEQALDIIGID